MGNLKHGHNVSLGSSKFWRRSCHNHLLIFIPALNDKISYNKKEIITHLNLEPVIFILIVLIILIKGNNKDYQSFVIILHKVGIKRNFCNIWNFSLLSFISNFLILINMAIATYIIHNIFRTNYGITATSSALISTKLRLYESSHTKS